MKRFDLLIIGSGPGGYVAAEEAARLGQAVAVIERDYIGGCCLNVGCIPSKTYLQYSHWMSSIESANKYGIKVSVEEIDFSSIVQRKNEVVSMLRNGIHSTFKKNDIQFIEGEASFTKDRTFEVAGEQYKGENVLLATGGTPFVPNIPGLNEVDFHTTDTFFEMEKLPEKLVTIGGGVIATELAFALQKLGVDVTVIEVAPDVLLTVDEDARKVIKKKMKAAGIAFFTNTDIEKISEDNLLLGDGQQFPYDELLVATGRQANLDIPNAMGLSLDSNGQFVTVDEYYETNEEGVYAIGDLIGGYTLAHAASAEGIKAVRAIHGAKEKPVHSQQIPRPLFTDPEVSEFGMSEAEAKQAGYDTIVKQMPFAINGRAIAADETEGFIKIISERTYQSILGGVVAGANATDLLHQIMTVYEAEGTVDELANMVYAHPTISEVMQDTAKQFLK